MTPPLGTNKSYGHVKYLGLRPPGDQDNSCRQKLSHYIKDTGCFYELYPEKFYMVYLAKGERWEDLLMSAVDDSQCPFIWWTRMDFRNIVYEPFNRDFGPFNLAATHQFCSYLKVWLTTQVHSSPGKIPVMVLDDLDTKNKLNLTLLAAIASMVIFKLTDQEVIERLKFFMMYKGQPGEACKQLVFREKKSFSDVSGNRSVAILTIYDCIQAFYAALQNRFYDYYEFDHVEYLFYETVLSGDLNWIIPGKILAFAGPVKNCKHPPSFYYHYFKDHNVSSIVRLNDPDYDGDDFIQMGFDHHDLIFPDGFPPTSPIAATFVRIVDQAKGAVAVHCYAGIGRTGTLIAAYLMARYDFTAHMAIAWTRICRPGSVIGEQQDWLCTKFDDYLRSNSHLFSPRPLKTRKIRSITTPETPQRDIISDDIKICPPTPMTRSQTNTTYAMAEKTLGQARALKLTKKQREKSDSICTRSSTIIEKRSQIDGSTSSSKGSQEANNLSNDNKDIILDLGKTLPITLELSALLPLKGKRNPEFYYYKRHQYEFKIKFPPPGYVDLRHNYEKDMQSLDPDNPDCLYLNDEPHLEFGFDNQEALSDFENGNDRVDGIIDVTRIPRLKPVAYYTLIS